MKADQMQNYYFTFGSDRRFPFGMNEYVIVRAESLTKACELFKAVWPPRPGSTLVNCAGIYDQDQWNQIKPKYYRGCDPSAYVVQGRSPELDDKEEA